MIAVLDASVAAKIVFYEKGTELVQDLLSQVDKMYEPILFRLEMDAILTKKVRKKEIDLETSQRIKNAIDAISFNEVSYDHISLEAFKISTTLSVTFYDALYISTAIIKNAMFYTADERLVRGLENTKLSEFVKSIYD